MTEWQEHQDWERAWWGNCINTFGEETKQITYAHRMGLQMIRLGEHWPVYDLGSKSILDLGGGVVSMLLKTVNGKNLMVVDPILEECPEWVKNRYETAGIRFEDKPAEEFTSDTVYDECWMYNVLQHTKDPELIINNAKAFSKRIRIFEWIDCPPCIGHPHELKEDKLNTWLNGTGTTEYIGGENGCNGRAYYGSMKGN